VTVTPLAVIALEHPSINNGAVNAKTRVEPMVIIFLISLASLRHEPHTIVVFGSQNTLALM
jgi:hypothetical protein